MFELRPVILKAIFFNYKMDKTYPIQQLKPCCSNPNIIFTGDGRKYQLCTNCGWEWRADKNKQIVFSVVMPNPSMKR